MKKNSYLLPLALLARGSTEVDLQQVETENAEGSLPQVTIINQLGEVTPLLASAVAQGQRKATSRGEAMPEIESIEMIKIRYINCNNDIRNYNYEREDLINIYH